MVQNKAEIASESINNPRASRALEWALDPGRKGLRAREVRFAHIFLPPLPPKTKKVLALSGCTGISSGPSEKKFENPCTIYSVILKGMFPQTTMWNGWVESNFTNPTLKVWADLDNPFKRNDYAKLCMSPSLDGTLSEYVISQEDNSPLTLYIYFHNF